MRRFIFIVLAAISLMLNAGEVKESYIPVVYYFDKWGYKCGAQQSGIPLSNWYYYWSQTSAGWGTEHRYNPELGVDGRYIWGEFYVEVGPNAAEFDCDFPVEVRDGHDSMTTVIGIDNFGSTLLHERGHMEYYFAYWWPSGYIPEGI